MKSTRNPFDNRDGETMGSDIEVPEYIRAGGDCLCPKCGREYIRHHGHPFGEYLTLHLLCTGEWVKL